MERRYGYAWYGNFAAQLLASEYQKGDRVVSNGPQAEVVSVPSRLCVRLSDDIEDSALTAEDQQELVKRFKALVLERTGKGFPNDVWAQLRGAAGAVFGSWMNDRAIVYRRKYNIPAEWGTAVNVQAK